MKYSELIEKYANGELDAEQAAAVESDVEKHEAISGFLAERDEIPELEELAAGNDKNARAESEEARSFSKKVRKQIRRSFLKAGIITGALVLAAVLFCMFALPKIVERACYDPTEIVAADENGIETNRLSLDISVYSELFLPGKWRQTAYATSLGWGNYSISIQQNHSRTGIFRDTGGMLQRGRLTLYDPNLLHLDSGIIPDPMHMTETSIKKEGDYPEDAKIPLDWLVDDMQPGDVKQVWVTFEDPMSYTEAIAWCVENGIRPEWGAVCTGNEVKTGVCYGANFMLNSVIQSYDSEKYPYLTVFSLAEDPLLYNEYASEKNMRQHLVSLLSYAADNPDGMRLFYSAPDLDGLLKGCRESAEYIRDNGFSVYGIMFTGDRETIESIFGLDEVAYISAEKIG